jgi:PKD repeat protein
MKGRPCRLALLLVVAAFAASSSIATTIVMPSDRELIEKSPVIVVARVVTSAPVERNGGIWTETTLAVERTIRGDAVGEIVVREVGGVLGERVNVVFGSPLYGAGQRVLAFLGPTPRGDFQTVDLFVGKFTERRTVDGERIWHRADQRIGTHILDADFRAAVPSPAQRDGESFERYIAEVLEGGVPGERYWVHRPQLAPDIAADFTLIDEPNLYRWFAFDDGASVTWRHTGAQTGYTSGGVGELQSGMNAWSGYSSAKIRFVYGGASASTPGGLQIPNGINEVMFGDPKNEIQGSWTGGSGVVGKGGFNSLKGFRSWTSPFAADAAHPARTYTGVGDIAEGNLVIQDGVSPAAGIPSALLAEIIAHEFGHALGFGHSSDAGALMWAQVNSGGPSLRADDQLAARWLYPNSSGGGPAPTAPAAPSGLTATGSGNALHLTWKDNATNEAVQTIYLGTSSSNLVPVQSVGANVTSTVVSNLIAGQTYFARVAASNAAGESPHSNLVQAVVPGDVLKAAILATPTSGIAGMTQFTFIDKSTGPVASRQWTFGDGGSATGASASHAYANAGMYTVTLRVFDSQGKSATAQRQIAVGASAQSVAAAFVHSPRDPAPGDEVEFSDQSLGPVTQRLWSFGDGATSLAKSPVHRYMSPGAYEVNLTVTNGAESSTATAVVSVSAGSGVTPAVDANFEISTSWPAARREVRFFDRSSGSPNSWLWSFGDGSGSVSRNPSHVYERPGTYRVILQAGNAASISTEEREITIGEPADRFSALLPVAALTTGAASSFWRTELSILNPHQTAVNVDLLYLPSKGSPLRKSVLIGAGTSLNFENALSDLYDLLDGSGAVTIEASGSGTPGLRISSRTFTTGAHGTFGQAVPALPAQPLPRAFLPGLEWSADFRTNIGFVNHGSSPAEVRLTLFDAAAATVSNLTLTLAGGSFQQASLAAFFPQLEASSRKGLLLRVETSEESMVGSYASVVDNRSQDPVFVTARAASAAGDQILPVAARAAGALGTFWRSDVTIFNPSPAAMSVTVKFLGGSRRERTLSLAAGRTETVADILTWLGEGDGQGPLLIMSSGSSIAPIVSSRTYTTRPSGGTFGQSINAVRSLEMAEVSHVVGLRHDVEFRTNVGFVNRHAWPINVAVRLLGPAGSLETVTVPVPALASIQAPAAALFPARDLTAIGIFSIEATVHEGVFVYASVVDNLSGDPVFVAGY